MGVALYGAYAADVNLDSSALKDAGIDCSTTWDESEFQSPMVQTVKSGRMLVLKNQQHAIEFAQSSPILEFYIWF